jgi:hypothetical protein
VARAELVDGVGREGRRIVGIRLAAGQAEAALADRRGQVVLDVPAWHSLLVISVRFLCPLRPLRLSA